MEDLQTSAGSSPDSFDGDLDMNVSPFMAEEYRKLMISIRKLGQQQSRELKLLMLTSARPEEGVTTVAVSLAASLANDTRNSKVLLLDCNLRKPSIHSFFDMNPSPGLVEVITNFDQRKDFIRTSPVTQLPNLHVLTAGDTRIVTDNTLEVLEHERLKSFLSEVKGYYNFVIIDAAPANPYSDVAGLAPFVDGTILVVAADSTQSEVAIHARDRLIFANANLLGVVFNKRKMFIPKVIYRRV